MWILGEAITLPSGRRVALTEPADADRPWAPLRLAWLWHVVRQQAPHADRPSLSFYFGGESLPLQLVEEDAQALAEALNCVMELE